jgi:hypothetical protein
VPHATQLPFEQRELLAVQNAAAAPRPPPSAPAPQQACPMPPHATPVVELVHELVVPEQVPVTPLAVHA